MRRKKRIVVIGGGRRELERNVSGTEAPLKTQEAIARAGA